MRRSIKFLLASLIMAPLVISSSASASDLPKDCFLATYELETPKGKGESTYGSNGKGIFVWGSKEPGEEHRYFADFNNNLVTNLFVSTKTATKQKIDPNTLETIKVMDGYKKAATKDLGSKTLIGHPCHGYLYEIKSSRESGEAWIAEDLDILISSTNENGAGYKTKLTLKNLDKSPPESAFDSAIPSDYKVVDTK